MPFPSHIAAVLDHFGIQAATKAALYELYIALGEEALEVFGEIAEGVADASTLGPEVTESIRHKVVARYLDRNHSKWLAGVPTPSLWHPRELEGRASGLAVPLGEISDSARRVIPADQPVADGIVVMGRNAHFGGRSETVSFDVIPRALADAIAVGTAVGQQHTLPGSVGETSGTMDSIRSMALIWEVQPNVYKPAGERNREIAKIYRRHRNWHLLTLATAIEWLLAQRCAVFVLRGDALAATHEVNPEKPLLPAIARHHDRTLDSVIRSLGSRLEPVSDADEFLLLESAVMNNALRKEVLRNGAAGAIVRVVA